MELRRRLGRLQAGAGRAASGGDGTPGETVAERLQRLGPARRSDRGPATEADEQRLLKCLSAVRIAPGVLLIERRIAPGGRHGMPLSLCVERTIKALPEALGLDPSRVLYLDTETTGLSGGAGTHLFLLGLARLQGSDLLVRQYLLTRFSGEAAMLSLAGGWLDGIEGVVTYNGKAFDLPLLVSRCRLAGVEERFSRLFHLDLLHTVRRAFGRRWSDCRLSSAEQRIMGFERRDDLPGAAAPQAWLDYLRRGAEAPLAAVVRHNLWDLTSLAQLLPLLDGIYANPHEGCADTLAIARAWLTRQGQGRALELLEQSRPQLDATGLLELARLYKRLGRLQQAQAIWDRLAEQGEERATEALAKYHEHISGDLSLALGHARRLPPGASRSRRCLRLRRKLGAAG